MSFGRRRRVLYHPHKSSTASLFRHDVQTDSKYGRHKTEGNEISPFQAFCVSTASRVGVGNIAGIAIAIVSGGPGAIFWMWFIAVIGSATGFVESTLAQIYKVPREGGNGFRGGPAYYLKNGLGHKLWAAIFAILISVTYGMIYNSVQSILFPLR